MSTYTSQAPDPTDRAIHAGSPQGSSHQDLQVRRWLEIGGVIAAVILIAFGGGSVMMSMTGRGIVKRELLQQKIVGAADMNRKALAVEAKQANLPKGTVLPNCDVSGKQISDGSTALCFASYMRIHALESTGGKVYSELPQYASADGLGTNDPEKALKSKEELVENPQRALWVQETALSTALNASYMADQLGLFGIVVGVALLLAGIGFGILALSGALRAHTSSVPEFVRKRLNRLRAGV